MQKKCHQTAFCLGFTWGHTPRRLAQKSLFRCHFCLYITLLHESHSQAGFSVSLKVASSQLCHSPQSCRVTPARACAAGMMGLLAETHLSPWPNVTSTLRCNFNLCAPDGDLAPGQPFSKLFSQCPTWALNKNAFNE